MMETNNFIIKLKANGSAEDWLDMFEIHCKYKQINEKLLSKDIGQFSVNVLCTICRNLEKVVSWRDKVDIKALLTLAIDCIRDTRCVNKNEQIKTLACIYHIHKFAVQQNKPVPPEIVLKLSYMSFECNSEHLLEEYCKTYWNILVDRLTYIEKLKAGRLAIIKLLPKLIEDTLKVIKIYDTVKFCSTILLYLVKKLHSLYSVGYYQKLDIAYADIFKALSEKDMMAFKKCNDREVLDLYVKFSDCFYVIVDNSSRNDFKESSLSKIVQSIMCLFSGNNEILHCLQEFYIDAFSVYMSDTVEPQNIQMVFEKFIKSCRTVEKLRYSVVMKLSYPYLSQLIRCYIECRITKYREIFTENVQKRCMELILLLMRSLKDTEQIVKCENCTCNTGLHDSIRLSFVIKQFMNITVENAYKVKSVFPFYEEILKEQYSAIKTLQSLGCSNYIKYLRKVQTDVHNIAISFNKANSYDCSIKLFDMYIVEEFDNIQRDNDLKNISRALYNKGICELDSKKYHEALISAHMSMIFAYPESLNTDKHMSLAMDVKAKALKENGASDDEEDDDSVDSVQRNSVLDSCRLAVEGNLYGDIRPYIHAVKFSELLKHEFQMYAKLWPSTVPIAGVCASLEKLLHKKNICWLSGENNELLLWTVIEAVLETSNVIRTIHHELLKNVVMSLVDRLQMMKIKSIDLKLIYGVLLFLKCEYELTEAHEKYNWKASERNIDPDQFEVNRTLQQEHEAIRSAIEGVRIWTELYPDISKVSVERCLQQALRIGELFVPQLLLLHRTTHALQLAHVCCALAVLAGDNESYVRNAGCILSTVTIPRDKARALIERAGGCWKHLLSGRNNPHADTAVMFTCDLAIYYAGLGQYGTAARLVRQAQRQVVDARDRHPDINMKLALGRLLEAYCMLPVSEGGAPSTLYTYTTTQRHYLTYHNTGASWCVRRRNALLSRHRALTSSIRATRLGRAQELWRRARSSAAVVLPLGSAITLASLYASITAVHNAPDAMVKIDHRLKNILNIQTLNKNEIYNQSDESKPNQMFTPKVELETMLECQVFKQTQTSPSMQCVSVPGFALPEVLKHTSKCTCFACETPYSFIMLCRTYGLQASMYFRAKELEISKNYFEGIFQIFNLVPKKLEEFADNCKARNFESFIVDSVKKMYLNDFRSVQIEILIETSLFELAQGNVNKSDDHIVRIHEIIQECDNLDPYLRNEVTNLMIASSHIRNTRRTGDTGLETEMDNLRLSPVKPIIALEKTPEIKPKKPPKVRSKVVGKEEIPSYRRKVIKLTFDDDSKETTSSIKKKNDKSSSVTKTVRRSARKKLDCLD